VVAGVATLLLPLVVLEPISAPWTPLSPSESTPTADPGGSEVGRTAESGFPQPSLRTTSGSADATGSPPRIDRVSFGSGPLTAARDLRLEVRASDPDGEIVTLRTTWMVNGIPLATNTPRLPKIHLRRGSEIAAHVIASDGNQESTPYVTETVRIGNAAPLITSFPSGFDPFGRFVYPIAALDPDGDRALEYHLAAGPPGMTIEPRDGTLRWQPASDQSGRHTVRVEVRDGYGGVQRQVFDLRVRQHRRLPPAGLASHIALP